MSSLIQVLTSFGATDDCEYSRWDVISASVDDRTRQERGLEPSQVVIIDCHHYLFPFFPYTYTTCNKIAYFSHTVTTFMKDIRIYPWNILLSWTYLYQAKVIPKSRYDSIDSFLSICCNKWDGYNDIEVGNIIPSSRTTKAVDKTPYW